MILRPRRGNRAATIAPPALAVAATALAGLIDPLFGLGVGAASAAAAGAWALRAQRDTEARTLDIDSAIVGRAMFASRPANQEERRIIQHASDSVRDSVRRTLQLLRAGLRAQSAVVLWSRSSDHTVRVREAETCSEFLRGGTFDAHAGILARVGRDAAVVNHAGDSGLFPWYDAGHEPASAVAVPLVRDGIPFGCLVVDRAAGDPGFDDVDVIAVQSAAEQIGIAIHMEFLVLEAANAARHIAVLDDAASKLNRALTVEDVCEEARRILGQSVPFDFFAVTECDLLTGEHHVVHADGVGSDGLVGTRFAAGNDTVSRAVRYKECLPYNGLAEPAGTPVFGTRELPQARSLLVLPLTMPQGVIGTLTVASRDGAGFTGTPRNLLDILVHHVAAALSNALAYSRMVRMATTDGMTGLTNHRTFKERGDEALARANRSGRPLCVILTDIDHFKSVNDTHGHAVGDEVIKGVASVLATSARDVDIVARYGGEEFAIVLEECDVGAATLIAERIRERVKELSFDGSNGTFGVTLSLGVAEHSGTPLSALIDEADQALYAAKRGGRDQVVRSDLHRAAA